ncbi:hypothetical protein LFZ16_20190 [Salmonella enterica subsp. enterica serovar India str. SA20085604]|nr:hypothetical protein LFZ16_20190 [Salmonella enterica subsp. enterica serovar India str. SA20085604]
MQWGEVAREVEQRVLVPPLFPVLTIRPGYAVRFAVSALTDEHVAPAARSHISWLLLAVGWYADVQVSQHVATIRRAGALDANEGVVPAGLRGAQRSNLQGFLPTQNLPGGQRPYQALLARPR